MLDGCWNGFWSVGVFIIEIMLCIIIFVGKKVSYDGLIIIVWDDDFGLGCYDLKKFVVVVL